MRFPTKLAKTMQTTMLAKRNLDTVFILFLVEASRHPVSSDASRGVSRERVAGL
jgi:hypothetical protein